MSGIILFDGDCSFCNQSVQFIIKRDPEVFFRFASLESEAGQSLKRQLRIPSHLDSMMLIRNNKWYAKSSAALRICKHLKGLWKLAFLLLAIPKPIRDIVYDFIARNRHRFFGKRKSCTLPDMDTKKRFL